MKNHGKGQKRVSICLFLLTYAIRFILTVIQIRNKNKNTLCTAHAHIRSHEAHRFRESHGALLGWTDTLGVCQWQCKVIFSMCCCITFSNICIFQNIPMTLINTSINISWNIPLSDQFTNTPTSAVLWCTLDSALVSKKPLAHIRDECGLFDCKLVSFTFPPVSSTAVYTVLLSSLLFKGPPWVRCWLPSATIKANIWPSCTWAGSANTFKN